MNKKLIPIIVTIFIFVMSCGVFEADTSITSSNFPMKERWSSKFDGTIYGLGVAGDWIAVGQPNGVTAIDTESGEEMWTMNFALDIDSQLNISDGLLITASTTQLLVIDKSGRRISTIDFDPRRGSVQIVATYSHYVVVKRVPPYVLEVYDIESRKLAWEVAIDRGSESVNYDSSTDIIYITSSRFVGAYSATNGNLLWKITTVARTGVLDSGKFYYYSESSQDMGRISAMNSLDATQLWIIAVPLKIRTAIYNLTIVGNLLVASTDYGLITLDKNSGNELWQSETNDFFYGDPILFDDILYSRGTNTNTIYAINPENGIYLGYLYLGSPGIISHREYELIYKSGNFLIFPYNDTVYAYHRNN